MLKAVIVSIQDLKAESHDGLYTQPSDLAAVRMFTDALLRGKDSMLRRFPDDYQLVRLGTFDSSTGRIEACDPFILITAAEVLRRSGGELERVHQVDLEEAINGK